jgi:dUTP pyrophosphatase
MIFEVKVLDPRAATMIYGPATSMSAGYDLVACIDEPLILKKSEKAILIPTGLAIHMDHQNVAAIILPRSGLGHKQGLVLGNSVGLIDADYQNQWFVSACNRGQQDEILIQPGEKIAQAVFIPVLHPEFRRVADFSAGDTVRGLGGFGSTGA